MVPLVLKVLQPSKNGRRVLHGDYSMGPAKFLL